jgi:hypothetical protein
MIALFNVSSVFGASFLALITPKFMALWACMNPRFLMIIPLMEIIAVAALFFAFSEIYH